MKPSEKIQKKSNKKSTNIAIQTHQIVQLENVPRSTIPVIQKHSMSQKKKCLLEPKDYSETPKLPPKIICTNYRKFKGPITNNERANSTFSEDLNISKPLIPRRKTNTRKMKVSNPANRSKAYSTRASDSPVSETNVSLLRDVPEELDSISEHMEINTANMNHLNETNSVQDEFERIHSYIEEPTNVCEKPLTISKPEEIPSSTLQEKDIVDKRRNEYFNEGINTDNTEEEKGERENFPPNFRYDFVRINAQTVNIYNYFPEFK